MTAREVVDFSDQFGVEERLLVQFDAWTASDGQFFGRGWQVGRKHFVADTLDHGDTWGQGLDKSGYAERMVNEFVDIHHNDPITQVGKLLPRVVFNFQVNVVSDLCVGVIWANFDIGILFHNTDAMVGTHVVKNDNFGGKGIMAQKVRQEKFFVPTNGQDIKYGIIVHQQNKKKKKRKKKRKKERWG